MLWFVDWVHIITNKSLQSILEDKNISGLKVTFFWNFDDSLYWDSNKLQICFSVYFFLRMESLITKFKFFGKLVIKFCVMESGIIIKWNFLQKLLVHSTRTIESFIGLLKDHSINFLVDIRTIPKSRHNPQFNADSGEETER